MNTIALQRFIALIFMLHLSFPVSAQNPSFEGIYNLLVPDQPAYATVQVKGNEAIIILMWEGGWEPYIGSVEGNLLTASGVTAIVGVDIKISISLSNSTVANIRIESCNPVNDETACTYSAGSTFQALTVF